jgi:hypothetical protein
MSETNAYKEASVFIRIFHNAARDDEGRNLGFFGHKPEQPMVLVFAYTRSLPSDDHALEDAYREFNIGEGPLARDYRERKLRSLSVGDVVAIGDRYYACADAGWERLSVPIVLAAPEQRVDLYGSTPLDG